MTHSRSNFYQRYSVGIMAILLFLLPMVVVGAVVVLLGTAGMLTLTVGSNPAMIAVFMGAIGLGLGFVMPLMSTLRPMRGISTVMVRPALPSEFLSNTTSSCGSGTLPAPPVPPLPRNHLVGSDHDPLAAAK
mgnify:CR=1 FL=1